jgi:hypothetical protein
MATVVVLAVFALLYGGLAVAAFRRPLLGRVAWRQVMRRPGQTVLVVAGLMVGSVAITTALVAGDSVRDGLVLGGVDGGRPSRTQRRKGK